MMLGDLRIIGKPPAKFIKALAVIAGNLHPLLSMRPRIVHPDKSKESCVLASATVREFLFRVGFKDAEVAACMCAIRARRGEQIIHSLGVGDPEFKVDAQDKRRPGYWNGHMIVRVRSVGYLIDTTLYPALRPMWPEVSGMMAAPLDLEPDPDHRIFGMKPLGGCALEREDGTLVDMVWLDQPDNDSWRRGPDYQRRRWRVAVAERLVDTFGGWDG